MKKIIIFIVLIIFLANLSYASKLIFINGNAYCVIDTDSRATSQNTLVTGVDCPTSTCPTGKTSFLRLSSLYNVHVQTESTNTYSQKVCSAKTCSTSTSCSGEGFSISANTNAHIGHFNTYSTKICCTSQAGGITPPPQPTQTCPSLTSRDSCEITTDAIDCIWDTSLTPVGCRTPNQCLELSQSNCEISTDSLSCIWNSDTGICEESTIGGTVPLYGSCTISDPSAPQGDCQPGYICEISTGETSGTCAFPSCESKEGIVCQSDQYCEDGFDQLTDISDAQVCCKASATNPPAEGAFPCYSKILTLSGEYQKITFSECKDPDGDGIGTKEVKKFNQGGTQIGVTETVPCSVLTKKKAVPFFTPFNLILSIFLLIGYYLKRKL